MAVARRARLSAGRGYRGRAAVLVPWAIIGILVLWNASLVARKSHSSCVEHSSPAAGADTYGSSGASASASAGAGTGSTDRSSTQSGSGNSLATAASHVEASAQAERPPEPPRLPLPPVGRLPDQRLLREYLEGSQAVAPADWRWSPTLFVALGTKEYAHFMENWVRTVQGLGLPMMVYPLDGGAASVCQRLGVPHRLLPGLDNMPPATNYTTSYLRLRYIGAAFAREAERLLRRLPITYLVLSDVDIAWRRDPTPYFNSISPLADWFQSTDCLSHEFEWAQPQPQGGQTLNPRCGHIKGQAWGRAFNSGMYAMRNGPASLRFLDAYACKMEEKDYLTPQGWVIDDQLALNQLLEAGMAAAREVEGAPRVIWASNGTLRVHMLPVLLFANGHTGFVQRLPDRHGIVPYAIHATFQQKGGLGKRDRFREWGLWLMDPPEYYRGRFLQYDNQVLEFVRQFEQQHSAGGRPMTNMQRHLAGMAYQLAQLRDAWALGWATNRTVVLAQSWCWCDLDQTPFVLEQCAITGSDLQLPFRCPADYLINPNNLAREAGRDELNGSYRLPGFINHPQVPQHVRDSLVSVSVVSSRAEAQVQEEPMFGVKLQLPLGAREADALRVLRPHDAASVLSVRSMRPGLFGGFSDPQRNQRFDVWFDATTADAAWCCGGARGWNEQSFFPYQRPRPLTQAWAPWEYGMPSRPGWCDPGKLDQENVRFTHYANHVCNFTAARAAA